MKYQVTSKGRVVAKNFDTRSEAQTWIRMLRRERPGYALNMELKVETYTPARPLTHEWADGCCVYCGTAFSIIGNGSMCPIRNDRQVEKETQ